MFCIALAFGLRRRGERLACALIDLTLLCYNYIFMNMPVKTLLFDLDDTLVVEEASAEAAFIEAGRLARERYGVDPQELHRTLRKTCREIWHAFPSHPYCSRVGISSWEGMWAEFTGPGPELESLRTCASAYRYESWRCALAHYGIADPDLAAELADAFVRLRRQKHTVYEDALEALQSLSRNYILGLLTNGASDLQRRKIDGAGVGKYFQAVLISGDVGIAKPDRRVYEMLLARLEAPAESALMIGNSLGTDIQGARDAGMRTVWIHRIGAVRDAAVMPDWEIFSLKELDPILANISTGNSQERIYG